MDDSLQDRKPPRLRTSISEFFFANETPYGPALVRIFLPIVLLLVIVPRWVHARELFSSDGAPAPLAWNYGFWGFLPEPSGAMAVAMMTTLVLCLVTASIGWCTRASLICCFVLYTYLNMLDSLSTMTKYSVISSHVLLLLSISNCGAVWSVDSWLKRLSRKPDAPLLEPPKFPAWPRRLIQLFIGIVYFGASVTKMHTPAYFSGDQLISWLMSDVNNYNPIGEYLTLYPAVIVVFGYVCIVWEVLFIFLCWNGRGRIAMLGMGVLFHCLTTLSLGLYIFPCVCISIYLAFFDENDLRRLKPVLNRIRSMIHWPVTAFERAKSVAESKAHPLLRPYRSGLAFGTLTAILILAGLEIEYLMDPYGLRRPEGPHTLKEIEPERARKMLQSVSDIQPHDKLLSFKVGKTLVNGILIDQKYDFEHGERFLAQCSFNPPHEDMWVNCDLHDSSDRVIERVGQVVARPSMRCNFVYALTDILKPGEYSLVVKNAGSEVSRRKITLRQSLVDCQPTLSAW